ncbi:nickel-dependent hydrogenase large subunit [Thiomicrorhabdus heinhorstiae]|uniref:Nickel-dependent hydrogenase large subunit n=1 Tax=Thiomicrorhabdus heinhorstiae TaxID=2748010 RepID=A0ABS0BVG9_9GAMM|nr:nickel-dependent hydrogenase large subunit [Thiomicrorhabdus heinhorstiae]MBF6057775.1 nickel-dependent hydrogenase large subunit [Thiomicrorhabdus heinhorstiae]
MSRILVGPFNRVEGDLEVQLEIEAQKVTSARVNSTLFRGFESMLQGRPPSDALVYAPRICGICSVSQSVAAAQALSQIYGITPPENGQRAINLMLANENAADLLTHFYLFFMPDFARGIYKDRPWFAESQKRFKAMQGLSSARAIEARSHWLKMMGTLAGHWPHTLAIQPGGCSRSLNDAEVMQMLLYAQKLRHFLETVLLHDRLENFLSLENETDLQSWQQQHADSDLGLFLSIAADLALHELGKSDALLMSYGSFPESDGQRLIPSGVYRNGEFQLLNPSHIQEDISHANYQGDLHSSPWHQAQTPHLDNPDAYSWCKAPRLKGEVAETGSLARQVMAKQPLILNLMQRYGSCVYSRILARTLELVKLTVQVESWLQQGFSETGHFFTEPGDIVHQRGVGLIEAARGSLGHWLEVKNNRIYSYQIIAPTTWNFSPRDQQNTPGALEKALENTPLYDGETDPVNVQHIVRSFDPCMVCTVH